MHRTTKQESTFSKKLQLDSAEGKNFINQALPQWKKQLAHVLKENEENFIIQVNTLTQYAWHIEVDNTLSVKVKTEEKKGPAQKKGAHAKIYSDSKMLERDINTVVKQEWMRIPHVLSDFYSNYKQSSFPLSSEGDHVKNTYSPSFILEFECSTCYGKGKCTCPKCRGRCEVNCSKCSGSGKIDCSRCDGEGKVACSHCEGRGTLHNHCYRCNGTGRSYYKNDEYGSPIYNTCSTCNGNGYTEFSCSSCRRGKVACEGCGASGKVQCSNCSGKGVVQCSHCRATGSVTCENCVGTGELHDEYAVQIVNTVTWNFIHPQNKKDIAHSVLYDLQNYVLQNAQQDSRNATITAIFSKVSLIADITVTYKSVTYHLTAFDFAIYDDNKSLSNFVSSALSNIISEMESKISYFEISNVNFWKEVSNVVKKIESVNNFNSDEKPEESKLLHRTLLKLRRRQSIAYGFFNFFLLIALFYLSGYIFTYEFFVGTLGISDGIFTFFKWAVLLIAGFITIVPFLIIEFVLGHVGDMILYITTLLPYSIVYYIDMIYIKFAELSSQLNIPYGHKAGFRTIYALIQGCYIFYKAKKNTIVNIRVYLPSGDIKNNLEEGNPKKIWPSWWIFCLLTPLIFYYI